MVVIVVVTVVVVVVFNKGMAQWQLFSCPLIATPQIILKPLNENSMNVEGEHITGWVLVWCICPVEDVFMQCP